jgi:hypothetical protein
MQFKNKWDKLKQDYGIWKQLVETGIGWDESGKNIVMPNAWWKKTTRVSAIDVAFEYCLSILIENLVIANCFCFLSHFQVIKGCGRFKNKGIQHEDKLSKMFKDLRNIGDEHWSASSGSTFPNKPISRDLTN